MTEQPIDVELEDEDDPGTPPADIDPATLEDHPEDRC